MNILEIYEKYQIMPQQAEHQLMVAGVADMILDNITPLPPLILRGGEISREDVIKACLLHDMGNIVKFDFEVTHKLYPELFVAPKDRGFWEKVKSEFSEKYGKRSHGATMKVLVELGVSQRIRELVDCVGFDQGKNNAQSTDFSKKLCAYSDMRVSPKGVVSLEERMDDLRVRYQNHREGVQRREEFEKALREIEKQIFAHCKIRPEEITGERVKEKIEKLKGVEI